jgi:hypothetical protein
MLQAAGLIERGSWQTVQGALVAYIALLLAVSGAIAFRLRQREPFFIVASLGMLLAPNVLWYHHYVFGLLPAFVVIAWSRLHPAVVTWCLLGLMIVQIDRWRLTEGLLSYGFAQLSLLGMVGWQVACALRATRDPQPSWMGGGGWGESVRRSGAHPAPRPPAPPGQG